MFVLYFDAFMSTMKTNHCSEVCFYIYRVLCEPIILKNIVLSAPPCNIKTSLCRDKSCFRTTRELKPPSGEVKRFVQFCQVQPKEPDLWPHVLGSEG
jgi:hypothetical protein